MRKEAMHLIDSVFNAHDGRFSSLITLLELCLAQAVSKEDQRRQAQDAIDSQSWRETLAAAKALRLNAEAALSEALREKERLKKEAEAEAKRREKEEKRVEDERRKKEEMQIAATASAAKEELARKAAERKKEEAEQKREEAERKKGEAERKKEETEQRKKEEAERKREETEQRKKEEAERKREEAERKREEAEQHAASSASKQANARLQRSNRRLSGFLPSGIGTMLQGGDGDGEAADGEGSALANLEWEDPRKPKQAAAWRGGGKRSAELIARVAWPPLGQFELADCLAADDLDDMIVCMGSDGDATTVATYSASKGDDLCLVGHRDAVCCVAMNGELIASGSLDYSIRLWSRSTGEKVAVLEDCIGTPLGLAMTKDYLLSGEGLQSGPTTINGPGSARALLWSLRDIQLSEGDDVKPIAQYIEHSGPVVSAALSESLAVTAGSTDKTVRMWSLAGRRRVGSEQTFLHAGGVNSTAVNYSSTLVVSGCADGNVYLWSLSSFKCVRILDHSGSSFVSPVTCTRIVSDMVLSGGQDGHIKIWSLTEDCECVTTLTLTSKETRLGGLQPVQGIAASSLAGFLAATGDDKIVVFQPKSTRK